MPTPRVVLSRLIALMCVLALFSTSVLAQAPAQTETSVQAPSQTVTKSAPTFADYSKGRSAWTIIGPYQSRPVPPPSMTNTPRIDSLVRDSVLYLSLSDSITLALENNLDIAIARYNLNIADTDILRTKAGAAFGGVNTGVVSNTLGGTGASAVVATGGGAGGTSVGAGGAGAGIGGQVFSTSGAGPAVDSFDPSLIGTLSLEQNAQFQSNPIFTRVSELETHTTTANFTYQQGFQFGELLTVGFNNSRVSTNGFSTLNPTLSSGFRATARQHLLNGFSFTDNPNTRYIRIAKNNRTISDTAFKNQIISTVTQIQNLYWDLVNAYEDLKVKQHSLELANRTLSDNKKQVEIGTLAPIEVVNAQSAVAGANQDLIVSQTGLQYQQLLMINALTRSVAGSSLASVKVVPTDTMTFAEEPVRPVEDLIADAISKRPELQQSRLGLKNQEISMKGARNNLLPALDLVGWYQGAGINGVTTTCATGGAPPCTPLTGAPQHGYSTAFGDLFDSTNPDKGIALQLTIPIRNRVAQATQIRSVLEYRQAQMLLQQQENNVTTQVRGAAYSVQQNRARVDAARAARDYAAQSLDAEQKKFALGASTSFNVLQMQKNLIQAETAVVAAVTNYQKARVTLDQVTGNTLERNNIYLKEAVTGEVSHTPKVPGVIPATPAPTPQQ